MKDKLKAKLQLLFLGMLTFTFFNCEKDFEEHNHNTHLHKKSISISNITLKSLENNTLVYKKLTNASKLKPFNNANRIINDTINNFIIDTEIGTLIEYDGYTSYTFKVIRENGSNFLLENLIIDKYDNQDYRTYLYQYDITLEELNRINNKQFVDFTNKIIITNLENPNYISTINGKLDAGAMCQEIDAVYVEGTYVCPEGGHNYSNYSDCPYYQNGTATPTDGSWVSTITLVPCNEAAGGDGGDAGGADASGEYGGGGGGGSTTTTPTNCTTGNCIEEYESPCNYLKNGTNSNAYKQKFKDLNTPANYNEDHETGFAQVGNDFIDCEQAGEHHLDIPAGSKNLTHVHNNKIIDESSTFSYDENVKIPSDDDLLTLLTRIYRVNIRNPQESFVVMVSNEGIYAITVLNNTQLPTDLISKWNDFKDNLKVESNEIVTDPNNDLVDRKRKLQKLFLKQLKFLGLENNVGLFEASIENESDPNIENYAINWSRKTLNSENQLIGTPCDN